MFNGMNGLEILKNWPRYESGELVRIGDEFIDHEDLLRKVERIVLMGDGYLLVSKTGTYYLRRYGQRVRRPAPAVLAADGEPLEVGETVWHVATGSEYTVRSCTNGGAHLSRDGKPAGYCRAEYLTHQRPVLDADGVPIRVGDTVWDVETGIEFEVSKVSGCAVKMSNGGYYSNMLPRCDPSLLTHTKPEPKRICRDCRFWQKEPDARTLGVCWKRYAERRGVDSYEARIETTEACEYFEERGE